MKISVYSVMLLLLLNFNDNCFCQFTQAKDIYITGNMPANVSEYKNLNFRFSVKNSSQKYISIDTVLTEKKLQSPGSNFEFVVEKRTSGVYKLYDNRTMVDPAPIYDDTIKSKTVVKLYPQMSHDYNYHLEEIFQFIPGFYRIRVKLDFNDDRMNNHQLASQWNCFYVQKLLPVHHWWQDK